ncbi:Retrovirus-related Pol polyprotein from transposon opus [Labeo rohita]|uniref:Retrovirus-related Pol polyprotein from transposon opus n=1 Tax=Labeo rohita TaxID=84645 RepID=A0ABQ8L751_LABRO|nr:Retrovirus-related Pol polyprotein from transposon opus [Labeo rohita]
MNQFSDENIDKYVTDLRMLASMCNFGQIKDCLIRDRIVCGITSSVLRERLLIEQDLTLKKCVQICRATELSREKKTRKIEGRVAEEVLAVKHAVLKDDGSRAVQAMNLVKVQYEIMAVDSIVTEETRCFREALEGLQGIYVIADDILITGEGETLEKANQDHDDKLRALLNRCREKNIKLNAEKFQLRRSEVSYIGHLLTADGLRVDPEKRYDIEVTYIPGKDMLLADTLSRSYLPEHASEDSVEMEIESINMD